jgi:hypothetical protein
MLQLCMNVAVFNFLVFSSNIRAYLAGLRLRLLRWSDFFYGARGEKTFGKMVLLDVKIQRKRKMTTSPFIPFLFTSSLLLCLAASHPLPPACPPTVPPPGGHPPPPRHEHAAPARSPRRTTFAASTRHRAAATDWEVAGEEGRVPQAGRRRRRHRRRATPPQPMALAASHHSLVVASSATSTPHPLLSSRPHGGELPRCDLQATGSLHACLPPPLPRSIPPSCSWPLLYCGRHHRAGPTRGQRLEKG